VGSGLVVAKYDWARIRQSNKNTEAPANWTYSFGKICDNRCGVTWHPTNFNTRSVHPVSQVSKLTEFQQALTAVNGLLHSQFLSDATLRQLRLLRFELESDIELLEQQPRKAA
jgi:hypothetical protein